MESIESKRRLPNSELKEIVRGILKLLGDNRLYQYEAMGLLIEAMVIVAKVNGYKSNADAIKDVKAFVGHACDMLIYADMDKNTNIKN